MIYLVNEYLVALNSGIEHSELERLAMFRQNDVPAKLVTRNYDQLLAQHRQRFDLRADQMINMFDYFQDAVNVEPQKPNHPKIESLNLAADYNVDPGADVSHVYDGDSLVMDIRFTPGQVGQLFAVDYYNAHGHRVQSTLYDFRGFKSRDQFFDDGNQLITQYSYAPSGERKVEEFFTKNSDGNNYMSLLHLPNYNNQDLYFNSYDELFIFFLDELNQTTSDAIFIADRPGSAYDSVLNMQTKPKRYATLPTTHTIEPNDQVYANLNPMYAQVLIQHAERLDGVVVATPQQKADLTAWMGGAERATVPIKQASFASVPDAQFSDRPPLLDERTANKLIFVGRLSANQRLDQMLTIFQKVRAQVPTATLDLYGYGDVVEELKKQLETLQLTDAVTFKGYQVDLNDAYNHAQVYLSTTQSDAQPLAMVDALAHGLPVVAFDTHYGPADLVTEASGHLIPDGDTAGVVSAIVKLLTDHHQWRQKSRGAFDLAKTYRASHVITEWLEALQ